MPRIFISYRRADSQAITDRIYEHLTKAFGRENVFKDVDDIPISSDFLDVLVKEIKKCNVMLVIIGRHWVVDENGNRRLCNASDVVRFEIEQGLTGPNINVIPVAVEQANFPSDNDLPSSIRQLEKLNGIAVRNDPDFDNDIKRLIRKIGIPNVPCYLLIAIPIIFAMLGVGISLAFLTDNISLQQILGLAIITAIFGIVFGIIVNHFWK